jgi:aquaporin Z
MTTAPCTPTTHWPEYLMESAELGLFMVVAAGMATVLEHPSSPVHALVPDPFVRRALMGVAMGLTAVGLIYSPWGQRSGAHLNPAVTLTFLRLGKVPGHDAMRYVGAQFAGGIAGIAVASVLLAPWIAHPSVNYVATVPGWRGPGAAFAGEAGISFLLMTVVLTMSGVPSVARFTGVAAGLLVATFITFEAPLSGMSMNPARTFGSGMLGGVHDSLWIYFVAPVAGMLSAAEVVVRTRGVLSVHCGKLHHGTGPCIFCQTRHASQA